MKKTLVSLFALLTALLLASCGTLCQKPVAITAGGKPVADIVVGKAPAPAVKTAAGELQHWLKEISGAELAIGESPSAQPSHIVLACDDDTLQAFPEAASQLKGTNGYAVELRGNNLYVIGATPKGVMNGVFQLLYRNTDIIWARPNLEFGTLFTPNPDITFARTRWIDIPKFSMIGWQIGYGASMDEFLWAVRNRCNWTNWSCGGHATNDQYDMFREAYYGHNVNGIYIQANKYYAKHPEYYPLIKGKRVDPRKQQYRTQLCFSNEEMVQDFIKEFDFRVAQVPNSKIYGVYIEDNHDQCQCDKCLAPIKLADGTMLTKDAPDFYSTRFFIFLNQIAKHAKVKYPGKYISAYAYFFTEIPPAVPLEDNILILNCPINKNVKFPVTTPENEYTWSRLRKWFEMKAKLISYEYFGLTRDFPRPADKSFAADMRYIYENGVRHVHSELKSDNEKRTDPGAPAGIICWNCNSLYFWVMSQLLWDPYQDVDDLRDEYLERVFGPAAGDVKEYLSYTEKAWHASPQISKWNTGGLDSWTSLANLGYVLKCKQAFANARSRNLLPKQRKMLERLALTFEDNDYFDLIEATNNIIADVTANPGKYSNLAKNPSFEDLNRKASDAQMDWVGTVFKDWNFWQLESKGKFGCARGQGVNGSNAAFVQGCGNCCFINKVPAQPGEFYYVSLKTKCANPAEIANLNIRWQNGKNKWTAEHADRLFAAGKPDKDGWRLHEGVVKVPQNAAYLLPLAGSKGITDGRVLFDDLKISKVTVENQTK